jgi:hypothetical protein
MNTRTRLGMASALALCALPAFAQQPYYPDRSYQETPDSVARREAYDAQRQQYEDQQRDYQYDRNRYEDRRDSYERSRLSYREARLAYERRLADWERARVAYDARYGYGAYVRLYPRPVWNEAYYSRYPAAPYAGSYGHNASANIRCSNSSSVTGGVLGALAGAVLGSNVAGHGARTEGAVLGGVVGAGLGAAVGHANDQYRCDSRGPYFTYNETVPYREGSYRYSSRYDYGYYARNRCRLAPAPIDSYGRDYRYVRVCPDDQGRYRITG